MAGSLQRCIVHAKLNAGRKIRNSTFYGIEIETIWKIRRAVAPTRRSITRILPPVLGKKQKPAKPIQTKKWLACEHVRVTRQNGAS